MRKRIIQLTSCCSNLAFHCKVFNVSVLSEINITQIFHSWGESETEMKHKETSYESDVDRTQLPHIVFVRYNYLRK
jgi:hypothetical protein